MKIRRYFCTIATLFALISTVKAQQGDEQSSAAPAVKTFALGADASGAASNNVNLFTGDVALPLNLVSLPGHNGLDVNVSISYSSNVQNQINVWNQDAPAGILGLGWDMNIPKIIADYKQTGLREDDTYYLSEGGSSNRLVRTTKGTDAGGDFYAYETKNYQFWKIKYYYDWAEVSYSTGGSNKWEITKEDGTKYVYGDKNSGRNTIQWAVRWDNWIGSSAQTSNQSQLAYIWNLSEITNRWSETVRFEYDNKDQFVGSTAGKKHTEASYLKKITDVSGRQVVFNYLDKATFNASAFYLEPHTEQAEPDAYQEVYEKNYLSYVDVLREDGSKLLTVQFSYTTLDAGANTAKMLLSSIIQKNSDGQSLPGMQFSYNLTGATKGFLNKTTYSAGGTVEYGYQTATLGHSQRESPDAYANAPAGYGEPKIWSSEDYTVIAWRQLGAGPSHDAGPKDVRIVVYQWVGEWVEHDLGNIGSVEMSIADPLKMKYSDYQYKDFQVIVQKDFFAILNRISGNQYSFQIRYKDEQNRGKWLLYSPNGLDMGDGEPTLFSGENFVGVGTKQDGLVGSTYHTTRLFTFQGNNWKADLLNQTCGDYYYTAANNYFISHNRAICGGSTQGQPEFNFHYLSEDKKWGIKTGKLPTFPSSSTSYWNATNSFAVVVASDQSEFIYRWNLTYNTFYKDDVLGGFDDPWTFTYTPSNSLVGLVDMKGDNTNTAIAARFDGVTWQTTRGVKIYNSFGDDFMVAGINGSATYRKVYNPNILTTPWQQTPMTFTTSPIFINENYSNPLEAGNNMVFVSDKIHLRKSNGAWSPDITLTVPVGKLIDVSSVRPLSPTCFTYEVWTRNAATNLASHDHTRLHFLKNGGSQHFFTTINGQLAKDLLNPYTVIAFASANYLASTGVSLHRIVNDQVVGSQIDYPVTLITTNDGTQNRYTSIEYNFGTATLDASGNVAQYNEATMIPGSAVAASKPYGYTKTFFYNGLTASELGVSPMPVDLRWTGVPYATRVYDARNVLVASTNTKFSTFTRDIKNDAATKVEVGYYVRPAESTSIVDGITTSSSQTYDINTGLITISQSTDYDSKGNNRTYTRYKYYWEQYDPTRATNLLSPVIQTKTSVITANAGPNEVIVGVTATTWKNWGGVMAPHKSYQWKRTGTADFDFSTGSDSGEPTTDWLKLSHVDAVDTKGNALQISTR